MKVKKNDQSDDKRKLFENKYTNNIEKELNQNIFNSFSGHPSSKIEDESTDAKMPRRKYIQSGPI